MTPRWHYDFPLPLADYRTEPGSIPYGYSADIAGVDGRRVGVLERFPGFREVTSISGIDPDGMTGSFNSGFSLGFRRPQTVNFFKYAEVQKGTTTTVLSGFVVRIGYTVVFHYYDPETSEWDSTTLTTTSVGDIDATFGGRFLWIVDSLSAGTTLWWDAETGEWQTATMGHLGDPSAITDTSASTTNGAIVAADISTATIYYRIAYRLRDSRRRVVSPIQTATITDTTPGSNFCLHGRFTLSAEDVEAYDTIELFRGINMGALLYREVYYHVPTEINREGATLADLLGDGSVTAPLGDSGGTVSFVLGGTSSAAGGTTYYIRGELNDTLVAQQSEYYDADTDEAGDEIVASRIYYADGVNFLVGDDTTTDRYAGDIRYSRADEMSPEVFPSQNLYPMPRASDKVQRFLRAGDFIYAIARNRLFRLARTGAVVTGERISHGWGLLGRYACAEMGTDIALVGPSTLVMIAGATGAHTTVGIVERVLTSSDEWRGQGDNVFAVYDAKMSCLFVVNPDTEDALCLWGTTNVATRLLDMNFVAGTSGPVPGVTGPDQAFFITENGRIFRPDADWDNTKQTQLDADGTVNGTFTTATTGTTLTDATASFASTLQDAYLYIRPGTATEERVKITGNTGTTLTVASSVTVGVGDEYSVSPVPFEWVGWPLTALNDPNLAVPRDLFRRRKLEALGLHWASYSGETAYGTVTVGVRESPYEDDLVTANSDLSMEPDDTFGSVSAARPLLFPTVRCVRSNLPFALRAVMANGDLEGTIES